jgi:hypothetical protein
MSNNKQSSVEKMFQEMLGIQQVGNFTTKHLEVTNEQQ